MNPPRPPQATFRCVNDQCPHFMKPRTITLQHVGLGLYLDVPTVRCECGRVVYRQATP